MKEIKMLKKTKKIEREKLKREKEACSKKLNKRKREKDQRGTEKAGKKRKKTDIKDNRIKQIWKKNGNGKVYRDENAWSLEEIILSGQLRDQQRPIIILQKNLK